MFKSQVWPASSSPCIFLPYVYATFPLCGLFFCCKVHFVELAIRVMCHKVSDEADDWQQGFPVPDLLQHWIHSRPFHLGCQENDHWPAQRHPVLILTWPNICTSLHFSCTFFFDNPASREKQDQYIWAKTNSQRIKAAVRIVTRNRTKQLFWSLAGWSWKEGAAGDRRSAAPLRVNLSMGMKLISWAGQGALLGR